MTESEQVGLETAGPTTLALVKAHLRITDTTDDGDMSPVVAAVNGYVQGLPLVAGAPEYTARVVHGATMLAARIWRRRNSPDGISAFGDGTTTYVRRNDPDVALLLGIGEHAKPKVG